jgi:hypothetical protein
MSNHEREIRFPLAPFGWLRTGFDKLRANGIINQS